MITVPRSKRIHTVLLGVLLVFSLLGVFSIRQASSRPQQLQYFLQKSWTYETAQQNETISLPCLLPLQKGEWARLSCTLPEQIPPNSVLCFFSCKQMGSLALDGTQILAWGSTSYPESAYGQFHFIPLSPGHAGKELSILLTSTHGRISSVFSGIYLGTMGEVLHAIWQNTFGSVALCLLVMLIGLISVVLSFYYPKSAKVAASIRFFGGFLMLLACWGFTQTGLPYLLSDNQRFLLLLEELPLLSMPVLLVLAFRPLTYPFSSHREYDSFFLLFTGYLVLALLLDWADVVSLPDMANWGVLFLAIFVIYVFVFSVVEFSFDATFSKSQQVLHSSLLLKATACVLLAGCMFAYFSSVRHTALLLGISYLISASIVLLLFFEMQALLQIREDLVQSRMDLLLSQIKPHFLYNTLNSIRTLLRTDPETADKLVYNFSRFLRSNMLSLNSGTLIPFSQELDHIYSYVRIEETCFPKLKMKFDIQVHNFRVPPLSIQPLVENAIKHGVLKKANGGTVSLRTYETDTCYCVDIEDDGVGFQVDQTLGSMSGHGLENVRLRLEHHCNARLQIISAPGEGCTARVILSKKQRRETNDAHDSGR